MMFEKAKPLHAPGGASAGAPRGEDRALSGRAPAEGDVSRSTGPAKRLAGDALRALEWSELTARLNAARDLRLLLRSESQAPIEAVAASFGDAAASYFALLDDSEPPVNPDALGQSKVSGVTIGRNDATRPGEAGGPRSDAPRGDARDMQ
jgi:hypothetical protein